MDNRKNRIWQENWPSKRRKQNALYALDIFCLYLESMGKKDNKVHSEYTASSKDELLRYLKQQDTKVPVRTKGRKSQHCEKWAVFRLLATWANANYFSYPIILVHRDRPDFLLRYNDREVGIEFTEAVSQEMAETRALAKHMEETVTFSMDQFKRETPKRTTSERRKIIQDQPVTDGWIDDEPEREWAQWIMDRVLKKTKDFNKPDFEKFDENLLLIYDNLPLPYVEIETAMECLIEGLNNYWLQKNRYDGVLIDTGNQLVEIQPSKWNRKPIIDLWT